ncbi:MAG: peptide chain release factor N(5)-glutamine methyltransferase [Gammaproteobacteria bacterium]|nr:MAG: peptide chain release factor N(5)-glutamine methyltransferase [Gammaproteobacteria bacterium]
MGELLKQGRTRLGGSEAAASEAEILLAHLLQKNRAWLYAWPERELTETEAERYRALLERRAQGEPVAYLTGQREFWSLPLEVDHNTLIPRPETEELVAFVLEALPSRQPLRVVDLGTGSGAIALALASERPAWQILACDRDAGALRVARRNASRLELSLSLVQSDWLEGLAGPFDLIIANPPYVAAGDPHLDQGDLRYEPRHALASGPEGLDAMHRIVAQAMQRFAPGGWLVLEHGYDQGEQVRRLLTAAGLEAVETRKDLAGNERFSHARAPLPRPHKG